MVQPPVFLLTITSDMTCYHKYKTMRSRSRVLLDLDLVTSMSFDHCSHVQERELDVWRAGYLYLRHTLWGEVKERATIG